MKKVVNINGKKMLMDEDGKLYPIDKKYYDMNELHSNNFAFKRPNEEKKVSNDANLFNSLENKTVAKSTVAVKMVLSNYTLQYLQENVKLMTKIYNDYGLHSVPHMISDDVTDGYMYIYFDDDRYELLAVGKGLKKRLHFAEKLLGEDE